MWYAAGRFLSGYTFLGQNLRPKISNWREWMKILITIVHLSWVQKQVDFSGHVCHVPCLFHIPFSFSSNLSEGHIGLLISLIIIFSLQNSKWMALVIAKEVWWLLPRNLKHIYKIFWQSPTRINQCNQRIFHSLKKQSDRTPRNGKRSIIEVQKYLNLHN